MTDPWEDIFWLRREVGNYIIREPYVPMLELATGMSLDDYFDTPDLIDL